jgi:hypothetical protein
MKDRTQLTDSHGLLFPQDHKDHILRIGKTERLEIRSVGRNYLPSVKEVRLTANCVFPLEEGVEKELSVMAGQRICACIGRIARGEIKPRPQPEEGVSLAVKIRKSDGFVSWNEDAAVLERKVRAYHNWPSIAFRVAIRGRIISVKITKASATSFKAPGAVPGKITAFADNRIMVSCGSGSLLLDRIVPEGKKEMSVADFLNGAHLSAGDLLLDGTPERQPNQ